MLAGNEPGDRHGSGDAKPVPNEVTGKAFVSSCNFEVDEQEQAANRNRYRMASD